MPDDDFDDDDQKEFGLDLLARIATRVADGIAAIGDPSIRAPALSEYWNGHIVLGDDEPASLMVDFAIDRLTLRVYADSVHFDTAPLDDGAGLASLIVARVAEYAADRRAHSRRLEHLREGIESKFARDAAGMKLLKVMCVAVPAEESIAGCTILMTAQIELLDATLEPYCRWLEAWSPRDAAAEINQLAPGQRRRVRTRARLAAVGSPLEIDAVAEWAIAAAGKTFGGIVADLVRLHRRENCDFPFQLKGSGDQEILLLIEDGCVVAQLEVPGKVITRGEVLQLYQAIPETTAMAAVGRPATDVVDLPALRGRAVISKATVAAESQRTYFKMRISRRPISAAELSD